MIDFRPVHNILLVRCIHSPEKFVNGGSGRCSDANLAILERKGKADHYLSICSSPTLAFYLKRDV